MTPRAAPLLLLTSIGQIAITVKQLGRATAFYRDTLGLGFLYEASNMAFFDCGGTRLMLNPAEQPESTYSSIIYYRTDDIRKTVEQLRSRGGRIRIRTENDRQDAGSRVVDGFFPRFGRQPGRSDQRSALSSNFRWPNCRSKTST